MIPLDQSDFTTATWMKLRAYCEKEIETLRKQNDGDLPPEITAKTRGRIAELKGLLALEKKDTR